MQTFNKRENIINWNFQCKSLTNFSQSSSVNLAKMFVFGLVFFLLLTIKLAASANILFVVGGLSTYSHHIGFEPLANKLSETGHSVTFFSPVNSKTTNANITIYCPSKLAEAYDKFNTEFGIQGLRTRISRKFNNGLFVNGWEYYYAAMNSFNFIMDSPDFKEWIKNKKFDLFVVDSCSNDWVFAWAHALGAKTILWESIGGVFQHDVDILGIPSEDSFVPGWDVFYEGEMGLIDRIYNIYSGIFWGIAHTNWFFPQLEKRMRDENLFPDGFPSLEILKKNVALTLINQHTSDHFVRSLPPSVIRVGGLTLTESSGELSEEIEAFLNSGNSSTGFIYISFGSAITISSLPPDVLQVFFETISSTNLKYLWKWEGELPKNAPKNAFFQRWYKQQDVLAHPKIKGFITQGGQISVQQAVFNGVPLVVLPVNGDQDSNAKRIRVYENGIDLEFCGLTVEKLRGAIVKIVEDPKYRSISQTLKRLSRDRPMHQLNEAVWWVNFVLRHSQEDLNYLKPLSIHQAWWQTRNLDAYFVIFTCIIICISLSVMALIFVVKFGMYNILKSNNTNGQSKRKRKFK